jgi:hypothetical protein
MGRINSRAKGCRGERALRDVFRAAGYPAARRGQQFAGGPDSPDVIVPELPVFHFESKCVEGSKAPYDWVAQAVRDSHGKIPVVCHKQNGRDWLAIMPLDEFIKLIKFYRPVSLADDIPEN